MIPDPARQIQVACLQDVLDEILEMPRVERLLCGRTPLALDEHLEGELVQPEGQGALVIEAAMTRWEELELRAAGSD